MHAKSDSDATIASMDATSTPPRSPRRAVYFVQSPSQHDHLEKISTYDDGGNMSPMMMGSPHHQHSHYHCSPIQHSRESSNSRFSSRHGNFLNSAGEALGWKRVNGRRRGGLFDGEDDLDEEEVEDGGVSAKFYVGCFLVWFVVLFSLFSVILWGASKSYSPRFLVKRVVFHDLTLQAGTDNFGVPTDMLSLNSTVRIFYRNRGTFFGVHVTSTPLEFHYNHLKLASGQMMQFYQPRRTQRNLTTVVTAYQLSLYGVISPLVAAVEGDKFRRYKLRLPLILTFRLRSKAYILGNLVNSKFYNNVRCPVMLDGSRLGKPILLKHSCTYD